jgi:D-xylose transport system substrate-binding protein
MTEENFTAFLQRRVPVMKHTVAVLASLLLPFILSMSCRKGEQPQRVAKNNDVISVEKNSMEKQKTIKIGLSLPDYDWSNYQDLITRFAAARGFQVVTQTSNHNKFLQNDQIENLVLQGIRVIIIVAEDGASAATAADAAVKAGVKVIALDRLIKSPRLTAYISFDNVEIGRTQARSILKRVDKGNFVLLYGSPTDNNAMLFRNGQMEVLKPLVEKGRIKIVGEQWVENWSPPSARKLMKSILATQRNQVDAVVASNDGLGLGALKALNAQGLAGKVPISGQDASVEGCASIVKGELTFTIFKDIRMLSKMSVDIAVSLAHGETVEGLEDKDLSALAVDKNLKGRVPCKFLPVVEVDRSNIDDLIVKSGFHKYEDVHGRDIPAEK